MTDLAIGMTYEPSLEPCEERVPSGESWLRLIRQRWLSAGQIAPEAFSLSSTERETTRTLSGARCGAGRQTPEGAFEDAEARRPGHYAAVSETPVDLIDAHGSACVDDSRCAHPGATPFHAYVDFRNHVSGSAELRAALANNSRIAYGPSGT